MSNQPNIPNFSANVLLLIAIYSHCNSELEVSLL